MKVSVHLPIEEPRTVPRVIVPRGTRDLLEFAREHGDRLRHEVRQLGAILLRGFSPVDPSALGDIAGALVGRLSAYTERTSPRTEVHSHVYTSTDYPAHSPIFFHNENSYQQSWPAYLLFYCAQESPGGGETLLADCRLVTAPLPRWVVDRFRSHGWRYVRNLHEDLGLSWQEVFQTKERSEVERYCAAAQIECEWRGTSLRLSATRPAFTTHPVTGEQVWFNNVAAFHPRSLPMETRDALLSLFDPADLPNNSLYGDGAGIPDEVVDSVIEAYLAAGDCVRWQVGDLLLLDNVLVAHGRQPFVGDRRVLVAMSAEAGSRD